MANSAINMKAVYISAGAVVLAAAVTGISYTCVACQSNLAAQDKALT